MRNNYILSAVFFVAALIFVFIFSGMHNRFEEVLERPECAIDTTVCHNENIVLALEFACNSEVVGKIFKGCSAQKEEYLKRAIYLDFGFLLAYTLTAIWFARLLFARDKTWKQSVVGISIVVGVADILENVHMLLILGDLEATADIDQYTWWLSIITWIKWVLGTALFVIIIVKIFRVAWHRFFRHDL